MSDSIPTVLSRDSEIALAARPIIAGARVLKERVVQDLAAADDAILAATSEAQQLVEDAKREAAAIEEQARAKGRREGLDKCVRQLAIARAEHERLQTQAEQDMVTMAFHIARRIIGHAIEVQPEVVRDIVGQALVSARGRREIVVRVHPEDCQRVQAEREQYSREVEGVPIYFEADTEIERGGCIIETESGQIDARLETQLQMLQEALCREI